MESVLPFQTFEDDEKLLEDFIEEVLTDLTQIKEIQWIDLKY